MPFGESTPFILIARCHVKQDCLAAYLEAAEAPPAANWSKLAAQAKHSPTA